MLDIRVPVTFGSTTTSSPVVSGIIRIAHGIGGPSSGVLSNAFDLPFGMSLPAGPFTKTETLVAHYVDPFCAQIQRTGGLQPWITYRAQEILSSNDTGGSVSVGASATLAPTMTFYDADPE